MTVKHIRQGIGALGAFIRVHSFGGDPRRPPVGQAHTFAGARGQQRVELSLRDICDSTVLALRGFRGLDAVDLDAVAQAIAVQIERTAPEMKPTDDGEP